MTALLAAADPALAPSSQLADVVAQLAMLAGADSGAAVGGGEGIDPGQAAVRDRMLGFAADHADALHRRCAEGHFTGSALVVDPATSRVLLLFHRKLQRWLQPGGHADGDANLVAVALREATEETGITGLRIDPRPIDLDIHRVAPPHEPPHLHLDVRYLVVAPIDAVVVGNHESEALRWVEPDATASLDLDPGTHRLIAAGLARLAGHR